MIRAGAVANDGIARKIGDRNSDSPKRIAVVTGCTVYSEIYLPVRSKESEDNYKSILNRVCAIKDAL